jgi:rod shape-determining protein MreC
VPHFFSNKRLIILLVSLIFLVALIGFSMRDRENISVPEQFVMDVVGWTQSIFYKPANYVAGFFENISELKNLYEENKLLKSRLDEYAELSVSVRQLEKENESLRKVIEKEDSLRGYRIRHATGIARSPDRWYKDIYIDKGKQSGIKENMAVITADGFIGKINKVSPFHSTVELLSDSDPMNRVSAVVEGDDSVFGIIGGYDAEKKALLFKDISNDVKVEEGEMVITSGMGGVFPEGLIIGEITAVVPDEFAYTQTAYVEPAADLYDISDVMVLERELNTINDIELSDEEGE